MIREKTADDLPYRVGIHPNKNNTHAIYITGGEFSDIVVEVAGVKLIDCGDYLKVDYHYDIIEDPNKRMPQGNDRRFIDFVGQIITHIIQEELKNSEGKDFLCESNTDKHSEGSVPQ